MLSVPEYWCHVPELSNLSVDQQRMLISPPNDPSCTMYKRNYSQVLNLESVIATPYFSYDEIPCVSGWDYDKTNYDETAATKFDLVCENAHYPSLLFTIQDFASFIGTPYCGILSDNFLPESPSWLVCQGRCEDAAKVMMRIGKTNGKQVDYNNLLQQLQTLGEKIKQTREEKKKKWLCCDYPLLKYPRLSRHFFILSICWYAISCSLLGYIQIDSEIYKQHEGYFGTDLIILNHGQMTRTTPDLAPTVQASTPHQRQGVWPLRFIYRVTGAMHDGSSVESGIGPGTLLPENRDLTTRPPRPSFNMGNAIFQNPVNLGIIITTV
ncbi:hypothetical protein AVEN_222143-1 [Araneus ventricosus]|uniref:Uncharacterized protein n=1 Tax=Araneus ventricosus TaxID=182803 RepID=A0A4Y2IKI9_ARAVE|nr:hypothetical protein AVEN_222143-1 [Araneus ventricosus]